jgi:hypothetical protein
MNCRAQTAPSDWFRPKTFSDLIHSPSFNCTRISPLTNHRPHSCIKATSSHFHSTISIILIYTFISTPLSNHNPYTNSRLAQFFPSPLSPIPTISMMTSIYSKSTLSFPLTQIHLTITAVRVSRPRILALVRLLAAVQDCAGVCWSLGGMDMVCVWSPQYL